MRPLLSTLVLATVIVLSANAQKFSPGYYITMSGDTVRKDISLQMKKGLIEKVVTPEGLSLAPKDIIGFGKDRVNYVVRRVSLDKTPIAGFVNDTVFLEVMNRGKIALYYMIDENEKAHFYIENENGPQELTVRLNDQNDGIVVRKIEAYKSVLKGIFPTCTDLFPAIDKTVFGRKPIQVIYEKLYKCVYQEEPPRMKKDENKSSTELGVFGGVLMADQAFEYKVSGASQGAVLAAMTFPKKSIAPIFGFSVETKFTRRRTLAFRHELSYLQYEQTSDPWKSDPYSSGVHTATVGASYLRYSAGIRGYLLPGNVRPFISAAVSPMFSISQTNEMKDDDSFNHTTSTRPIFVKKTHKATVAYFLGAGISYKSLALEFRFEPIRGFAEEIHARVAAYSFTLHYRIVQFKKNQQ